MTFEEANKRLEEVVKKLEQGNITLEEGTSLFEEGVLLAKRCFLMIDESKGKIVEVKNELEKTLSAEVKNSKFNLPVREDSDDDNEE